MSNKTIGHIRRAALLAALIAPSGCTIMQMSLVPRAQLWLAAPETDDPSYYRGLVLDPVRTITLPLGGPTLNLLKWQDTEVLEIPCERVAEDVALYRYEHSSYGWRMSRSNEPLSPDAIVDLATIDQCADATMNICSWLLWDPKATFYQMGRVTWHGLRHQGPALYVQCITAAEFKAIALSPLRKRIEPWTAPAWRKYLRRNGAAEAAEHPPVSDNTYKQSGENK